jgi:hypothetical protein
VCVLLVRIEVTSDMKSAAVRIWNELDRGRTVSSVGKMNDAAVQVFEFI